MFMVVAFQKGFQVVVVWHCGTIVVLLVCPKRKLERLQTTAL